MAERTAQPATIQSAIVIPADREEASRPRCDLVNPWAISRTLHADSPDVRLKKNKPERLTATEVNRMSKISEAEGAGDCPRRVRHQRVSAESRTRSVSSAKKTTLQGAR